jgi:hypothetical protein
MATLVADELLTEPSGKLLDGSVLVRSWTKRARLKVSLWYLPHVRGDPVQKFVEWSQRKIQMDLLQRISKGKYVPIVDTEEF